MVIRRLSEVHRHAELPGPSFDARAFEELFPENDELEDDELKDGEPPSDAIRSLIAELERRWPPFDESSPWAVAPLGEDVAWGRTLYITLVVGRPDGDIRMIADIARRLGIVCFDPQRDMVL